MHQRLLVPALLAAMAVAACGGKEEPPAPVPQTQDDDAARRAEEARRAAEAARADSIRRAEEEARRAAEEAARRARAALTEMIHFGYDQFAIQPQAEATLRAKAEALRANPGVRLRIEGHADERGSHEYNLALGMRRATAARDYLANFGISGSRFEVVSFGEERPIASGTTEEAYAQNRRDEFHIVAGGDDLSMQDR